MNVNKKEINLCTDLINSEHIVAATFEHIITLAEKKMRERHKVQESDTTMLPCKA
jgi:uncharacterized membrane protein